MYIDSTNYKSLNTLRILSALCILLLAATASFAATAAPAPALIVTPYFSVTAPTGWEVDRDEDEKTKVDFIKSSAMFDEIYLSINSTKMKKQLSIERAWDMLKPQYLTDRTKTIFDGVEAINGVAWQKIVYTEKVADMEMRRMVLFTIKGDKSYIVQVGSPDKKWDACIGEATEAIKSIKFKSK